MSRLSRLSEDRTRLVRLSRNSTGLKEEFVGPRLDVVESEDVDEKKKASKDRMLMIVFISMVFIGLGNKVFNKLQTIPMHNYPNFLNLLTTFIFVPVTFAYIIPASRNGTIPKEQLELPKKPFAIMGALDSLAGIMQIFATTYLPGPLVILLTQAAIPINMVLCKYILKAEYNRYQYAGAFIVAAGILTVLAPAMSGDDTDPVWIIVLILACVPMCLSSVYKEIALGSTEVDAMYLNGWIAVFQLGFSLILCVPASLVSEPPVPIQDLPQNMVDGLYCYFGKNSNSCENDHSDDCEPDDCYPQAPMFVTIYLVFNQLYNLLILLLIKYGSSNLLWLAMTIMVPLGNVTFTLPGIPERQHLRSTDIIGLIIICFGLGTYRFASEFIAKYFNDEKDDGLSLKAQDLLVDKEVITPFIDEPRDEL